MIKIINGKKFNVIPLTKEPLRPQAKYSPKSDGNTVKNKRLRQIEKGMIKSF